MDQQQLWAELIIKSRSEFAPAILAALIQQPWPGNDDARVAQAVSLSDKLAIAILAVPVPDES